MDFDPVIDNALAAGNHIPNELAPRAEVRKKALANGTANREAAKDFDSFEFTEEWADSRGWKVNDPHLAQNIREGPTTLPTETPYVGLEHIDKQCLSSHWGTAAEVDSQKSHFKPDDFLFVLRLPQSLPCSLRRHLLNRHIGDTPTPRRRRWVYRLSDL